MCTKRGFLCQLTHLPPRTHAGDEVETIIARGNASVAAMGNTQDPGALPWYHAGQQCGRRTRLWCIAGCPSALPRVWLTTGAPGACVHRAAASPRRCAHPCSPAPPHAAHTEDLREVEAFDLLKSIRDMLAAEARCVVWGLRPREVVVG